jgi:hypothetical protein
MLALYRERIVRVAAIESVGIRHFLVLGELPQLRLELDCKPIFGDISTGCLPDYITNQRKAPITDTASFISAVQSICQDSEYINSTSFVRDFENSLANLILNRALYNAAGQLVEPVFTGHTYYPFPGLRSGPDISMIELCSNVTGEYTEVELGALRQYRFESAGELNELDVFRAWSGREDWVPGTLPIHPWQRSLSPEFRAAEELGLYRRGVGTIDVFPLASQRTLRVRTTGYDLKLSVDAVLTGEHRLLFKVNASNAPTISALAERLKTELGIDMVDFQMDIASLIYDDDLLGQHLAVILRSPLPKFDGEVLIPAFQIWANQSLANQLFQIDSTKRAMVVFSAYCRTVLHGPLTYYACAGMAFEPHLQNSLIRVRNNLPVGLVLRDLDATIVEVSVIDRALARHGLCLPTDVTSSMPDYAEGRKRLVHSLMYANIAHAALYFVRNNWLTHERAEDCIEKAWRDEADFHKGQHRERILEARQDTDSPKLILSNRMKRQMRLSFG